MATSNVGPERKNWHLNVLKFLDEIYCRPYDDIIFNWCDGDTSRVFSDVGIDIENRTDVGSAHYMNVSVRLGKLYDTSMLKEGKMTEYKAFVDFLKGSDGDADALSQVLNSKKPNGPSKSEVVVALAVHLFAKLAPKSRVLVDINIQDRPNECPCRCGATYKVDHLGIGSAKVWHGRPDMEIGSVIVIVAEKEDLEDEEDETSEQGDGPSPAKKQKIEQEEGKNSLGISVECRKGSISTMDVICQTAAEVITNSYAQVKANRELADKFIPALVCYPEGIRVFMYNTTHDLLLYTHKKIPLLEKVDQTVKLNIKAALEFWLAIHVHVVGCSVNRFAEASSELKGWPMSKCGFKRMMEERQVLRFYENAGTHLKDFEEKKITHFEDLCSPYGRDFVNPVEIDGGGAQSL